MTMKNEMKKLKEYDFYLECGEFITHYIEYENNIFYIGNTEIENGELKYGESCRNEDEVDDMLYKLDFIKKGDFIKHRIEIKRNERLEKFKRLNSLYMNYEHEHGLVSCRVLI